MTAQTPTKSPTLVPQEKPTPALEDEIRRRAYELYEQRGREDGDEVEDWLRAEEEVTQKRSRRVAAFCLSG
jgi:Protein of unknown function (DUF2934)